MTTEAIVGVVSGVLGGVGGWLAKARNGGGGSNRAFERLIDSLIDVQKQQTDLHTQHVAELRTLNTVLVRLSDRLDMRDRIADSAIRKIDEIHTVVVR